MKDNFNEMFKHKEVGILLKMEKGFVFHKQFEYMISRKICGL